MKKQLGSSLYFFRTVHSCAGILKALKLSSIMLVSKEVLDWLFYEPSPRNYILPRFRGWEGWSWFLSHSALWFLTRTASLSTNPEDCRSTCNIVSVHSLWSKTVHNWSVSEVRLNKDWDSSCLSRRIMSTTHTNDVQRNNRLLVSKYNP